MRIFEMGNLGDLSPQGSVAVGILVGLISTTVQAIGLTLQRKSHILEDEKHPYDLRRPPYKRRRWQLGMLMFVISNIVGSTIQITTLPLPVLSTLQASGLVFNTIFASLILGEAFTRYSVVGTGLVCLGAILIAVFGAVGEPAHSLDQLLELLQRRNFILWMAGTAVLVLVISICSELLKFLTSPHRSRHPSIRRSYALHIPMAQSRVRLIRGLCFGSISGILSAHTLLFAKSAVELLVRTIVDRANQFNRWQSWLILITMVTLALTQLYQLHCGLKLCSTSVLYPFVFCIYNIIAILDGLIYFRQASQLAGFHAGLIALGTIILLGGVLCLSWRLEVIDSHAGVTVVGPSQTGLGPGMAVLEERPRSPRSLILEDEESWAGEREPLLQTVRGSPRQRTPSLPLISSSPKRNSTDTDPASIWAELDDSDYDYADSNLQSTIPHRSSVGTFPTRPRSNTWRDNILRGPRRATAGSISQHTWNSHRIRSPQKRRTYFGPFPGTNQDRTTGYGTQHDRTDHLHSTSSHPQSSTNSHSTTGAHSLPDLRGTIGRTWRAGLQYLSQWTSRHSRTESHDSITSPLHDNEPSRE